MNKKLSNKPFDKILLAFRLRKFLFVGIIVGFFLMGGSCGISKEATISKKTGNKDLEEELYPQKNKISRLEKELNESPCSSTYEVISGTGKCGFNSKKCLETIYIYCQPSRKLKEKKSRWVDNPWYGQGP